MTWRDVDDPNANLDELIAGYFADQGIVAASTARLLREHRPIPKEPLSGYDGRLLDWLTEMLNFGPPDGPERAWPIILQLVARAPGDFALTGIGCHAVEDLVNRAGAQFADRIIAEAANNPRFRTALRSVWPNDDVPKSIVALIRKSRMVASARN